MKSHKLWLIPGVFFLIACAFNLYGCATGDALMEKFVKGALMPLLAVTGVAFLAQRKFDTRTAGTLLLAQMLGWAGDSLLLGSGFAWFVTGIGCFLLGHICYIRIFCRTLKGLRPVTWVVALVVMAGIMTAIVLGIGINGALLGPMIVYGLALLLIAFCGLCGIFRAQAPSRAVWWMVTLGGLLFLFSDGLIAMRIFDKPETLLMSFIIMVTYLIAQALLSVAAIRISCHLATEPS